MITSVVAAYVTSGTWWAAAAVVASAVIASLSCVFGYYHRKAEVADQREVDAIHAEIAHTAKVAGIEEASRIVDLVYSQQLDSMDVADKARAQMLQGDPVAMAKYIQAVIDRGGDASA